MKMEIMNTIAMVIGYSVIIGGVSMAIIIAIATIINGKYE